jgi:hypothetical protein
MSAMPIAFRPGGAESEPTVYDVHMNRIAGMAAAEPLRTNFGPRRNGHTTEPALPLAEHGITAPHEGDPA